MESNVLLTMTILVTYLTGIFLFSPLLIKLKEHGFVGRDMYKLGNPKIPEMGGIGICFSFLAGILFLSVFMEIPYIIYLCVFVLMLYFVFGLVDDILAFGGNDLSPTKRAKMLLPLFFAYPLARYVGTEIDIPIIGSIPLGALYPFLILPIFIMVCANLTNMFSYYNGQSAGCTLIILIFVVLKLNSEGHNDLFYVLYPFMGATMAFLSYNIYPAGVFPGDSGDLMMGAMIGIAATVGGIESFVFVALLPYIVNFLMVFWWFTFEKETVKVKFGDVRSDNTIDPPNNRTLMWLFPYYFRLTERHTTLIMYALVTLSCLTAWFLC